MLVNSSHRRAHAADDAGISLVEVLVAMVISAIVGAMTLAYLFSAVNNARRADGQNEQAAGARIVIDSWSRLVPLAVGHEEPYASSPAVARFYSISPQSVRFCAATKSKSIVATGLDTPPIGVELALIGDELVEKRYATCKLMIDGGAFVRRVLAPNAALVAPDVWLLTPLTGANLFTAPPTGLITSSLTDTPLLVTTPADALKLRMITGVQLAFKTLPEPGRPAPPATYTTVLALTQGG